MSKESFCLLAAYNRWANARLYAAAMDLPVEAYRRPVAVFFGSLHGTLNHLLTTDRLWLKRLTGQGEHPDQLNAIIHEDLVDLAQARVLEDERLENVVSAYTGSDLGRLHAYNTSSGSNKSSASRTSSGICSIIRPTTAGRRTRAAPFSPGRNHLRSICWLSNAGSKHRTF